MRPFEVHTSLQTISHSYPTADEIAAASRAGGANARLALARLWLSEGIPFAFRERPAVYEAMRFWLATQICVDPKEISVIGSARIGQSLSPDTQGRPFSEDSDLDLLAVSSSLFDEIVSDFNSWAYDYEVETVSPANPRERRFWDDHIKRGPLLVSRGFLDADMVPRRQAYKTSQRIGQAMYLLVEKLKVTPSSPRVRHASLRVFRNWAAYVQQAERSMLTLRGKPDASIAEPVSAVDGLQPSASGHP